MSEIGRRIAEARGENSQTWLARQIGVTRSAVSQWESGLTEPSAENLRGIARITGINLDWLANAIGDQFSAAMGKSGIPVRVAKVEPKNLVNQRSGNAVLGASMSLLHKIPAYGQAMGGKHGEFILNGNKVADILAPPALEGVRNAYAVYIAGDSMEPRYYAGEVAFIHPGMAVRRGDFVVAQIAANEGEPPLAFVKRFVAMTDKTLKLEQLNPPKILEFPRARVESVHLVLMAGRG